MKIILKENIENLGRRGDIIDVAPGYGRNYLIPRKMALEVTPSNMNMVELEQKALRKKLEREVQSYQGEIEKLNQVSLSFERKTGDKDVIFGSVSTADIKEALDKLGIEVEKKKILLEEPIKRLGNYTVPIKVFHDERAEIKIEVNKEGAELEESKPDVSEKKEKSSEEPEREKEGVSEEGKQELAELEQEAVETEGEKEEEKKVEALEKKPEEPSGDGTTGGEKDE